VETREGVAAGNRQFRDGGLVDAGLAVGVQGSLGSFCGFPCGAT
jgi:hypothetical protein